MSDFFCVCIKRGGGAREKEGESRGPQLANQSSNL